MGGMMSMAGEFQNAAADSRKAKMYAQQGRQAQSILNTDANSVEADGNYKAGVVGIKTTEAISGQKAGYAASGVDTQSGSPLEAMADTRVLSTLDQQMIKTNAARSAYGMRVKGYQAYLQGLLGAQGAESDANAAVYRGMGDDMQAMTQLASFGKG